MSALLTSVEARANELQGALKTANEERASLAHQLKAATANAEAQKRECAALKQRSEQAMALAAKYSPEAYTALQ